MVLKTGKSLRKDEGGQAMSEFAIVFPVVFILILVFIQAFVLLATRHMVNYAAYYAARSAIVFYPDGLETAKKKAKRAAEISLISVSARKTFGSTSETFIKPIEDLFDEAVGTDFHLPRRYAWAKDNVEVTLKENGDTKDPHVDITADVTYYCVMGIPIANTIFYEMGSKYCVKRDGLLCFTLKASCTLPAAGKITTKKCCS